jgi:exodeoxyribonuclease VII large subunit
MAEWIGRLSWVWIEGQVTQVTRRAGQRTVFLTLRDPSADISLPLTCSAALLDALPGGLRDGAQVVVHARPSFYAARGNLTLSADEIRPIGAGELLARLEHLKQVLAAEGLFAAARKRPLPFLPGVVGLICGRASAAERDVVENARRRWPAVRFRTEEVVVQGPNAVPELTAALHRLAADSTVEVIVITRGGGSLEDLLPFSNETLLRAVSACRTPIVSAIGHETDTPLLDLVADLRASTPTDAAKSVVPDVVEEMDRVSRLRAAGRAAVSAHLARERAALTGLRSRPAVADPHVLVQGRRDDVLRLRDRSRRCFEAGVRRGVDDLVHVRARVTALSPAATLGRGYAVVQTQDGGVVRRPEQVRPGEQLRLRLAEGELAARTVQS